MAKAPRPPLALVGPDVREYKYLYPNQLTWHVMAAGAPVCIVLHGGDLRPDGAPRRKRGVSMRWSPALAGLVLALALAGCGGKSSNPAAPEEPTPPHWAIQHAGLSGHALW